MFTHKYRAWRINRDGDPMDGVEEEFKELKTEHPNVTAIRRAARALEIREKESIWLDVCFPITPTPLSIRKEV